MEETKVLSALIGLAGAVYSNGKSDSTDRTVIFALRNMDDDAFATEVRREKYKISPGCETCTAPCGNTSDFDFSQLSGESEEISALKAQIIAALRSYADACVGEDSVLPETVYRAISYLKYNLEPASYRSVLEEMKKC